MIAAKVLAGPVIETARLRLRIHQITDYADCCRLGSDPEAVRTIYVKPISPEDSWHRLMRFIGHWAVFDYGLFIVEELATGKVIGQVGLADFHRGLGDDFDPFPEFAWMLSEEVHGKGYATEAAKAALDWMEAKFAPPRTVCIIDPTNAASLRVAARLGYSVFGEAAYKEKTVLKLERVAVA